MLFTMVTVRNSLFSCFLHVYFYQQKRSLKIHNVHVTNVFLSKNGKVALGQDDQVPDSRPESRSLTGTAFELDPAF
jgi:hypothetical protein